MCNPKTHIKYLLFTQLSYQYYFYEGNVSNWISFAMGALVWEFESQNLQWLSAIAKPQVGKKLEKNERNYFVSNLD